MYGASEAQVKLENGGEFTLVQSTDYPFDGTIRFTAKNVKVNAPVHLRLRVPGWSTGGSIKGIGADRELTKADAGTYLDILVEDPQNMDVQLSLDMKVRYTVANNMVEETVGQAAIERGPLVYCCESVDTHAADLDDVYLDLNAEFTPVEFEIQGRRMMALETEEYAIDRSEFDRNAALSAVEISWHEQKACTSDSVLCMG